MPPPTPSWQARPSLRGLYSELQRRCALISNKLAWPMGAGGALITRVTKNPVKQPPMAPERKEYAGIRHVPLGCRPCAALCAICMGTHPRGFCGAFAKPGLLLRHSRCSTRQGPFGSREHKPRPTAAVALRRQSGIYAPEKGALAMTKAPAKGRVHWRVCWTSSSRAKAAGLPPTYHRQ